MPENTSPLKAYNKLANGYKAHKSPQITSTLERRGGMTTAKSSIRVKELLLLLLTSVFQSKSNYTSHLWNPLLYKCGCKRWILTAETEWRIQAFKCRCFRNILHISLTHSCPSSLSGYGPVTTAVHIPLSWTISSSRLQVYPIFVVSASRSRRQVFLRHPIFRFPWRFHFTACLVMLFCGFWRVCPIQRHLLISFPAGSSAHMISGKQTISIRDMVNSYAGHQEPLL
ncbi:hypothetical protein BsWGS_24661 [Bradybaena similaris]